MVGKVLAAVAKNEACPELSLYFKPVRLFLDNEVPSEQSEVIAQIVRNSERSIDWCSQKPLLKSAIPFLESIKKRFEAQEIDTWLAYDTCVGVLRQVSGALSLAEPAVGRAAREQERAVGFYKSRWAKLKTPEAPTIEDIKVDEVGANEILRKKLDELFERAGEVQGNLHRYLDTLEDQRIQVDFLIQSILEERESFPRTDRNPALLPKLPELIVGAFKVTEARTGGSPGHSAGPAIQPLKPYPWFKDK